MRLVGPGVVEVNKFITGTIEPLIDGGELKIFSPHFMLVCQKPLKAQA